MIENVNASLIPEMSPKPPQKRASGARSEGKAGADATVQVKYSALINKALHSDVPDDEAVERAKKLLLSGQLDTPENVRQAAANLIQYGI